MWLLELSVVQILRTESKTCLLPEAPLDRMVACTNAGMIMVALFIVLVVLFLLRKPIIRHWWISIPILAGCLGGYVIVAVASTAPGGAGPFWGKILGFGIGFVFTVGLMLRSGWGKWK